MALVFISHAHRDEVLARKVTVLLGDALGLHPSDFFLSSEAGRGVAPSAGIRASIASELRSVPMLVVLLTPKAAASPWVWIEAGERLGCADKAPPIFVIPSARAVSLLAPVADMRCLRMDDDGELHELVRAVGAGLKLAVHDVLSYKPALEDAMQCSAQLYSESVERRQRVMSWFRAQAVALLLMTAGIGTLVYGGWRLASAPVVSAPGNDANSLLDLNEILAKNAARFLVLKGRVVSGVQAVHSATVMASREEVQDPSGCQEPKCTKANTTTEGQFTLELTKINATNGDRIILSVTKPGFAFFSSELDVDVRAMDAATAPQSVALVTALSQ